jgi:hypothetical protein
MFARGMFGRLARVLPVVLLLFGPLILFGPLTFARVNVLTQHNDVSRTGANLNETTLTPSNVNTKQFGMLFKRVVDDQVYGQPLIATNVEIKGGMHDVVYLTTVNNSVYAFDANDSSSVTPFWHVNFGVPPNVYDGKFGCMDMNGNMGIIGSPVIDPVSGTLYVVASTRVGNGFNQRLHALDLATGADRPGSPVTITAPEFDPLMQSQRPALLLSRDRIYVGYSSHCDKGPYHGFLIGYDAKSLHQIGLFNTSPTGEQASIWQSGNGPAADAEGNIYFVTGNGSWDGKSNFGESFIKIDSSLKLLDWFTPSNYAYLNSIDGDLNTSGAMLVPGTDLVIDTGKQGILYLVNTNDMGHLGNDDAVQHFQVTGSQLPSMVWWKSAKSGALLYMWGQKDRLRAYQFDSGKLDEKPFATRPDATQGHPGAMMSLSANGDKNGILWAAIHATGDSWHESRPGILHAYDADNISHELWNSLENPKRDDCNNYSKMVPPTIANGKVYLASFGTQNTGSGQLCVYGLLPDGSPPLPPAGLHASVENDQVSLSWTASNRATTYAIKRSTGNVNSLDVVARGLTSTSFDDTKVSNGMTYFYEVLATNSNGDSQPSNRATVIVPKLTHSNLFPPGPGRDLTLRVCSSCHSPALAASQHLSPQGWSDVVKSMSTLGAVATQDEFNEITAYLAKSFPGISPQ